MKTELFVPGRLCLFGEHSDWAGGYRDSLPGVEPGKCLVTGTEQGVVSSAESLPDRVLNIRQVGPDGLQDVWKSYPAEPAALAGIASSGGFDSYIAGTVSVLLEGHKAGGLALDVHTRTLPLKKGLSSSAAVCVTAARAYGKCWDLGLTVEEEMELAYRGELLTGSVCGRMDQVCAFGSGPLLLTFDGERMDVSEIRGSCDFHLLIVDLCSSKDTRSILADLNAAFVAGDAAVRDALGPANRRVVEEACRAMTRGDAEVLGLLMIEAQQIFDMQVAPASPTHLVAPILHTVLEHPAAAEFAWGGKGVGSQGDGTAQFVCRGIEERKALASRLTRDLGVSSLELTVPGD